MIASLLCDAENIGVRKQAGVGMQQWAIQEVRGCSIHVLAVLGRGSDFRYAYTGFICVPKVGAMSYPQMQRFHHVSADFDSVDAAIAAGMREGRAIAERWFSIALEGRVTVA